MLCTTKSAVEYDTHKSQPSFPARFLQKCHEGERSGSKQGQANTHCCCPRIRARGCYRGCSRRRFHHSRGRGAMIRRRGRVGPLTPSQRCVCDSRREWGWVSWTRIVGAQRACVSLADGLQMRALGRDDDGFGRAAVGEELGQRLTGGSHVFGGDAEGDGWEANLSDEIADLVLIEVHESDGVCQMKMVRRKKGRWLKKLTCERWLGYFGPNTLDSRENRQVSNLGGRQNTHRDESRVYCWGRWVDCSKGWYFELTIDGIRFHSQAYSSSMALHRRRQESWWPHHCPHRGWKNWDRR